MPGPLDRLFVLEDARSRRLSSFDRSGGNADSVPVAPGETATLAAIDRPGVIRHIWLTLACADPMIRRQAVLRAFWDGEAQPSIECPLGDFFGQGWGESYPFASLPLAAGPAGGRALISYLPMPFARAALTLENQSAARIDALYYYVDYDELPAAPAQAGRLHAQWRRELTAAGEADPLGRENEWGLLGPTPTHRSDAGNFVFLEAEGRGHVVGVQFFVDNPGPLWYGEGDDMWCIDGEAWPGSAHGTGTEDFFNGAWSPNECFAHPYFGYARVPQGMGWLGRTHAYRFFLEDPIRFQKSLRGSIEHGHANCLTLDIAAVTYWYQEEPHRPFPALPRPEARENMPPIGPREVHRWRDAWRRQMGGGPHLWGHEREEPRSNP
jgi:hypothetical protein